EILSLVGRLQKLTGTPAAELLETYGKYLFPKLASQMTAMSLKFNGAIDLLCSLESIIHKEVLKLYPDAELPSFNIKKINAKEILMEYLSCRPFAHLAKGLIDGCGDYYQQTLSVSMKHLNTDTEFFTLITVRQS
ncbi:MAG: heme NO-binding domain-containing protein, partial [Pseudomonadales bacterium]|nr:heme NO-binding domain-containing protein [Pseudomonadales bacterium]